MENYVIGSALENLEKLGPTVRTIREVLDEFVLSKVTVNQRIRFNNLGNTLLHFVVQFSMVTEAKQLLYAGARADIRNYAGLTPKDIAFDNGDQLLMQILSRLESYCEQIEYVRSITLFNESVAIDTDGVDVPPFRKMEECNIGIAFGTVYENYVDWTELQRQQNLDVSLIAVFFMFLRFYLLYFKFVKDFERKINS